MNLMLIHDFFIHEKIKEMNHYGFEYMSIGYQRSIRSNLFGYFVNNAWMHCYYDEKLYKDDPLLEASDILKDQPILWNALSLGTKKKASIMNLRYEVVGIRTGITLCTTTTTGIKRILAVGDMCDEQQMFEKYHASLPLFNECYKALDGYMQEHYV